MKLFKNFSYILYPLSFTPIAGLFLRAGHTARAHVGSGYDAHDSTDCIGSEQRKRILVETENLKEPVTLAEFSG